MSLQRCRDGLEEHRLLMMREMTMLMRTSYVSPTDRDREHIHASERVTEKGIQRTVLTNCLDPMSYDVSLLKSQNIYFPAASSGSREPYLQIFHRRLCQFYNDSISACASDTLAGMDRAIGNGGNLTAHCNTTNKISIDSTGTHGGDPRSSVEHGSLAAVSDGTRHKNPLFHCSKCTQSNWVFLKRSLVGIAALLKAATDREWSLATIRSAKMTTADVCDNTKNLIKNMATGHPGTPLDYGAGHVNPNKVMNPGLVYEMEVQDYINFLCGMYYTIDQITTIARTSDFSCENASLDLNYLSFIAILNDTNTTSYTFKRVMTNVVDSIVVYTAEVVMPPRSEDCCAANDNFLHRKKTAKLS
ncbi:hypothetical protein Acr_28g0002870 [Actinidia rufa]|uniref:Uncharacterized protein n=1 Tax=Actinidia rufa TaxID=165716 RepID=A0A7J0H8Z6_9ERIC|nr:hypothetical protein Acr_28g0002870 [Actinidia rufa]